RRLDMKLLFALVLLVLLGAGVAFSQDPNSAWERVNKDVVTRLKGLDPNALQNYMFQLPSADLYATWADDDGDESELLDIANTVPNWGPTWLPTDKTFTDGYLYFVNALEIPKRANVNQ